jgi:hypothetical protein
MDWSVVSAVAACLALVVAVYSGFTSHRALGIAQRDENRRRPLLVLYLVNGYMTRGEGSRFYAFLLSVSNPSDSDNSVARLDLRIDYRTPNGHLAAFEVPLEDPNTSPLGGEGRTSLNRPCRVDSHQTTTGWAFFSVKEALLSDCEVEGYSLVATDTQGERASVETSLVTEILDEDETEVQKDRD